MRFCRIAAGIFLGLALVGPPTVRAQSSPQSSAQSWPQRPVRIIVPFGAGGSSDVAARIVAQRLGDAFGQPFVVENRAGASGVIAAETVARAPADGYTLLMGSTAQLAVLPRITKVPYDPVRDFAPISVVATNPFVLAVHPSIPARTVAELVAFARGQPQPLAYASTGAGSLGQLSMALFLARAGLDMVAVNYKGGSAEIGDVVAGHVKVTTANLSAVVPFARSGTLRLLAVTSDKRSPQIPDVPTFIESGFAGFRVVNWVGLLAPAGTDAQIVARVAGEVARAVREPKVAEVLAASGLEPVGGSPADFVAMMSAEAPLWAEAVAHGGLKAE